MLVEMNSFYSRDGKDYMQTSFEMKSFCVVYDQQRKKYLRVQIMSKSDNEVSSFKDYRVI